MTPFEQHGIRHLSASSVALYRSAPALWVLRYLYGISDNAGAPAWRGTAVEAAVDLVLYKDASDDEATATALASFDANAQGEIADDIEAERAAIPAYVAQAAKLMRPLGEPVARQYRIERWLDGIEVPVVGYADYVWADGVIDLKTTKRMPSAPRPDHAAQVMIYADATDRTPALAYVTPAKGIIYPDLMIDRDEARQAVLRGARAVRALLGSVRSKEQAAALFAPNFDDFHWTETTISAAKEIWK